MAGLRNKDHGKVELAILESARREIELNGILGLRVAEVAKYLRTPFQDFQSRP